MIGQILDYSKELASWEYDDLQREVSRALGRKGNAPYDLVRERALHVEQASFVDNVSRRLKRGEFLLLIIGDGIREGVANIVQFVQSYSGLHFNLALVEAALYRDTANRIIVQPRVLMRTEVIRRVVLESGIVEDLAANDEDVEDTPSNLERENLRFWTAMLDGYGFSDVNVDIPEATNQSVLWVKVRRSGFGDYGLSFVGFLDRGDSIVGCYLTCRAKVHPAVEIYDDIEDALDELRGELGDELERWKNVTTRANYRQRVRRELFEWPPEDCIPGSPWTGDSWRFGNRLRRTFGCGSTRRLSA